MPKEHKTWNHPVAGPKTPGRRPRQSKPRTDQRSRAKAALKESQETILGLLNERSESLLLLNASGTVLTADESAARRWNLRMEEMLGKSIYNIGPRRFARDRRKRLDEAVRSGQPVCFEDQREGKWYNISICPIRDSEGKVTRLSVFARDITERKRVEAALREGEERSWAIFEKAAVGIGLAELDGRLLDANPALRQVLGYTSKELQGENILDVTHPDDVKGEAELFREMIAEKRSRVQTTKRFIRKDGRIVWANLTASIHRGADGKPLFVVSLVEDITERRRSGERLKAYQARLRSLASQLSLAEERARRRLAVALHDDIGHGLALAKVKLGELLHAVREPDLVGTLKAIQAQIAQMIEHTRTLTFELSPPVLYELGFDAAVGWLAEDFQKRHGIHCEYEGDQRKRPLEDEVRVNLFQSTRELLLNVVKHARAKSAKVWVKAVGREIRVQVEDDGAGFAANELWSNYKKPGFGLFSIRERLESLGGRVEVESQPGQGTRVTLVAPLAKKIGSQRKRVR